MREPCAGGGVVLADVAEVVGEVFDVGGGVDDAVEGGVHAGAEFFVGRWWEGCCLGAEIGLRGRAGLWGVGGSVVVEGGGGGGDFGHLGFKVVEVGQGCGFVVAADGDEACFCVSCGGSLRYMLLLFLP